MSAITEIILSKNCLRRIKRQFFKFIMFSTVSGTVKWNMVIPRFPESTGSKNDFHVFSQAF